MTDTIPGGHQCQVDWKAGSQARCTTGRICTCYDPFPSNRQEWGEKLTYMWAQWGQNFYRRRTEGQKHSRVGMNRKEYRHKVIPNTHTNLWSETHTSKKAHLLVWAHKEELRTKLTDQLSKQAHTLNTRHCNLHTSSYGTDSMHSWLWTPSKSCSLFGLLCKSGQNMAQAGAQQHLLKHKTGNTALRQTKDFSLSSFLPRWDSKGNNEFRI